MTSLSCAALHGHTGVLEALLDRGVHPDERDRLRQVPLVPAATGTAEGQPAAVELLLDRGADLEAELNRGTALEWAACFGYGGMVRYLVGRGAVVRPTLLPHLRRHAEERVGRRQAYGDIAAVLQTAAGSGS
ncbi:ankyrin repeat domain-containing protein [Streptomyces fulvoviolaceus]|uniref:ankyrin repeat domain-containing protein n=1 Tax=Streptomyces fulvoviolaceus TaxID=285535 RepID=UPI00131E94F8|nr:ankyrin repeat domain-containing protein [Streptomyces fulvoviolaceus]